MHGMKNLKLNKNMCTGSAAIGHKTHACTHRIPTVSYITPSARDQDNCLLLSGFRFFPQQIACSAGLKRSIMDIINSHNMIFSQSDYKD